MCLTASVQAMPPDPDRTVVYRGITTDISVVPGLSEGDGLKSLFETVSVELEHSGIRAPLYTSIEHVNYYLRRCTPIQPPCERSDILLDFDDAVGSWNVWLVHSIESQPA